MLVILRGFDALIALVGHYVLSNDETGVVEVQVLNAKPAQLAPAEPAASERE